VAAVFAVVVVGASVATAYMAPGSGSQPEYTVASSKEMDAVTSGALVVTPAGRLRGLSEKLTLLAVGGLLLGLAAAVRRTT
jgi:hypothetical protein